MLLNLLSLARRIKALEENGGGGSTDSAKRSDIASEFSTETSYTAGTYVYYEGTLYIFNVDHAAGEWDATDVAEANVTDEVTSNKAAIDALEETVAGLGGVTTRHLDSQQTDGNGIIFLDLSVDDYILVGVSTKDFSAGWGPTFEIGCWQSSGVYKYAVKLFDFNGQAKASSNWELDIAYMARPTA